MYATTRDFVSALDAAGELRRVSARVSPILEIAQIADRVSKSRAAALPSASARRNDPRFHDRGGHALLFEKVEGSDIPVLINAWGSYRRMEMALGCAPEGFDAIGARIAELVKPQPPRSLREALAKARQFLPLLRVPPKRTKGRGLCQEIELTGDRADVRRLPIIRCWPHDGDFAALGYPAHVNDNIPGVDSRDENIRGRYITLAGIHTIHARDIDDPRPSSHNIGMYRVQVLGKNKLAMHWHMHHDGASHWRSWKAAGKPMPVAIALGGESVMPYAATCPLPPGISELLMAGFLNGRGIPLCRARTVPLWVPANAEIIIEGYVSHDAGGIGWDPGSPALRAGNSSGTREPGTECRATTEPLGPGAVFEGPFGDHTGFYSLPDRYPILTVTAITHRRDPIYPTTIVGLPPQEDYYLGKATERIMLPLLKTILPDIEDYDLPMYGAFHNAAFLKVKKHYPLHARRLMHGVWGAGQMSWTKTIVVVDHDVDVHDTTAVLRAAAENAHPARDTELVRGPIDILDHATPYLGAGTKMGIDATRKTTLAETGWSEDSLSASRSAEISTHNTHNPKPTDQSPWEVESTTLGAIERLDHVTRATLPDALAKRWLFVQIDKTAPRQGRDLIARIFALLDERAPIRVVVILGKDADPTNVDDALFHWVANMSPERDRLISPCGTRVAYDATPKLEGDEIEGAPVRPWPPLIRMDDATIAKVEARWSEYGV